MEQLAHLARNKFSSSQVSGHDHRSNRHRLAPVLQPVVLMVLILGILVSSSLLAQITYEDTEFDVVSDWTNYGPYVTGGAPMNQAFSTEQILTGGNPGAYAAVMMTRATDATGATGTWAAMINHTMMWDPSESSNGPIGKIDFRLEVNTGGAWSLAVEQDGYVWIALNRRIINLGEGWSTLVIDCLSEVDFVALPGSNIEGQPLHPDFSASGMPITFGIGTGLSCPSACTVISPITFKLDNFRVTVKPPFHINAGLNDAWYQPATDGQGFFLTVFPDVGIVFLAWFTYDTERPADDIEAILGEAGHRWLTAQGGYVGDTATLDLYLTRGGVFDSDAVLPDEPVIVGTLTIKWCDCEKGTITYSIPSLELSGTINIERVAPDNAALCWALL